MKLTEALINQDQAHDLAKWGYYLPLIDPFQPETHTELLAGLDAGAHQEALARWQSWNLRWLDRIKQRISARSINVDGVNGEAGDELFTEPRCGEPDILPATVPAQSNWPTECRNNITISYHQSLRAGHGGMSASQVNEAIEVAHANIQSVIEMKWVRDDNAYPNTRVFVFGVNLGGSVLADQYLATNNCGYRSQGRRGTNRNLNGPYFSAIEGHELLHALGLEHLNGRNPDGTLPLMSPYIHDLSISTSGKLTKIDIDLAVRRGYKLRTVDPDDPIDPPSPNNEINGTFTVDGKRHFFKGVVV